MMPRVVFRQAGGSLLEVLVAASLLSLSVTAAIGTQLFSARASRHALEREQAALIAASVASSMRADVPLQSRLAGAQSFVAAMLPHARISTASEGGLGHVIVAWNAVSLAAAASAPRGCRQPTAEPGNGCAMLPFAD